MADGAIAAAYVELRSDSSKLPADVSGALDEFSSEISEKLDAAMADMRAKVNSALSGVAGEFRNAGTEASDAFSSSMDGVRSSLGSVKDEADADMRHVSGAAQSATEETKGHFAGMGAAVIGSLGAIGGIEAFKGVVESGRDAATQLRVTQAIITSTGGAANITAGQISQMADAQSVQTGISSDQIRQGANVLLTFKGLANQAGANNDIYNQSVTAAENLSTVMGTSMTSSATMLGKALNDPAKGLTALQRVGVTFSAQEKQQIQTALAHNDVLGAQKVILGELGSEFGGAAKAAADPMAQLSAALKMVEEDLGQALLPTIGKFAVTIGSLLPAVTPLVDKLGDGLVKVLDAMLPAINTLVPPLTQLAGFLANMIGSALDFVVPLFNQLLGALEPLIPPLLNLAQVVLASLMDALKPLLPPITNLVAILAKSLAPVIGEIGGSFGVLVGAAGQILGALAPLLPTIGQLFQLIAPLLPVIDELTAALVQLAMPVIMPLLNVVVELVNLALRPLLDLIGMIVGPITSATNSVGEFAAGGTGLLGALRPVADFFAAVLGPAFTTLGSLVQTVWSAISTATTVAWNAIKAVITPAVDFIATYIGTEILIIQTAWQVAWNAISAVLTVAWDLIKGIVTAAIDVVRGVITAGIDLVTGHWGAAWDTIKAIPGQAFGAIEGAITGAVGAVSRAVAGIASAIWSGMNGAYDKVTGLFGHLGSDLLNVISGLAGTLANVGINIIHAIVSGIASAGGQILTEIEKHIPGGGVIKSALGLVGLATGGYIPGAAGAPQLIVGHGGEYVLSLDQLDELRSATAATSGGPAPLADLGFSVAPSGATAAPVGPFYITVPGADPATGYSTGQAVGNGIADVLAARGITVAAGSV